MTPHILQMTKQTQSLPFWHMHTSELSGQRNKYVTYKRSFMTYKKSAGGSEEGQGRCDDEGLIRDKSGVGAGLL